MSLAGFCVRGGDKRRGRRTRVVVWEARSVLQAVFPRADIPGSQEAAEGRVSGQLSTPSSKTWAFTAKVPVSQTPSPLPKTFKRHRRIGFQVTEHRQ